MRPNKLQPGGVILQGNEVNYAGAVALAESSYEHSLQQQTRGDKQMANIAQLADRLGKAATAKGKVVAELSPAEVALIRECGYAILMRKQQLQDVLDTYYLELNATTVDAQQRVLAELDEFTAPASLLNARNTMRAMPGLNILLSNMARIVPETQPPVN